MISIARPSRRVRESATAMRYCGLRILPSRLSLIFTDIVERLLLWVSRCNSAIRAGCQDPVLPRVRDREATVIAGRTAAHCARARSARENSPVRSLPLENFLEALGFHPAVHPPTVGRAQELVVVPQPAEHHLFLIAAKHHRVEADCPRRRGVPIDAHREI